jgi:hypothetical protein
MSITNTTVDSENWLDSVLSIDAGELDPEPVLASMDYDAQFPRIVERSGSRACAILAGAYR